MFFKFNLIFIITFLFFIFKTNGQEANRISLHRFVDTSIENSGLMQTHTIQNTDLFVVKNYDDYIIKEFYFQPLRYYYDLLCQNLIDRSQFDVYQNRYNEKSYPFCSDSIHNKIQILIALDPQNNKTVIFDMNHNSDFSDDSIYVFIAENEKQKIVEVSQKLPIITMPITYCLSGSRLFFDTIYIRPYPYPSAFTYSNDIENKYYLMIKNAMSKEGILNINGDNYSVIVSNGRPLPIYNIANTKIFVTNSGESKKVDRYYEIGDTIKLKKGAIKFDSLTKFGDTIYYKKIFSENYFDTWKSKVPNVKAMDIYGMPYDIQFDKKVVLIDFWGTWCKPCIEDIPKLQALYKKFKHKNFQIVSIAYDKKDDLDKLKRMVKKEGITWVNIFQDIDDQSPLSLIKKFKVNTFPTFILVDEKGNILFRSRSDQDDFEMLVDKLNHVFKKYK